MFAEDEPDLVFTVESNEDDTEISLVVRSQNGKKIAAHQFVMEVEQWLHEVTKAEIEKTRLGSPDASPLWSPWLLGFHLRSTTTLSLDPPCSTRNDYIRGSNGNVRKGIRSMERALL